MRNSAPRGDSAARHTCEVAPVLHGASSIRWSRANAFQGLGLDQRHLAVDMVLGRVGPRARGITVPSMPTPATRRPVSSDCIGAPPRCTMDVEQPAVPGHRTLRLQDCHGRAQLARQSPASLISSREIPAAAQEGRALIDGSALLAAALHMAARYSRAGDRERRGRPGNRHG